MTTTEASTLRGKTLRFIWKDGPTKGTTHEHTFHDDGTVEWRSADQAASDKKGSGGAHDRPKFADEKVSEDVRMVSYLAESGYTLTAVLNFENKSIVGVASNEKTWAPVHGSFEFVN